jgi:HEAT repeat protein
MGKDAISTVLNEVTMRRLLVWSFLLCLSLSSGVVLGNPERLVYSIRTDKDHYILGESVVVTFSWQNVTSKAYRIETWLMEPIEVFYENQETRIPFRGIISDGTSGYMPLRSGQKFERSYVINNFFGPNYAVDKPGTYILKSTYVSNNHEKRRNFWTGVINAPTVSLTVTRLAEKELAEQRTKILSSDSRAIQIVAAHHDEASIPLLIKLTKDDQINVRKMAYQALANIGSAESVRSLAEAAVGEPVPMEKVNILFLLKELKNPVVIPYLQTMLKDDYVGGFTTTQRNGGKPVRYRVYMVRKWAYVVLKELGVDIPTVYEEEIK